MSDSYNFGYWSKTNEEVLQSQFPLHRCCRDGDIESLSLLLDEQEYSIYVEDSFYGWTPAHWAAYFGKLGCLRKLLSQSEHSHVATSRFKHTPAHMAAYAGHPSLLQWLLQAGARLDNKDYLGETALHKAARTGSMECVSLLVAHKADISVTNNNDQTAGELARACGYKQCARYLQHVLEQRQQMMSPPDDVMAIDQCCDMDIEGCESRDMGGAGDILLVDGVGRNHVPIGGKKRPREDTSHQSTKRFRATDFPSGFLDTVGQCWVQDDHTCHLAHSGLCTDSPGMETDLRVEGRDGEATDGRANESCAQQRSQDVLFAIGASMSPSASILSVSTQAMERNNQQGRQNTARRRCMFAV